MAPPEYRIVGGGPVASCTALFLLRAGIPAGRIHLALPTDRMAVRPVDGSPRRWLALSEGSRQLLARIVAIPPGGTIASIEVSIAGRGACTRIGTDGFGVASLGRVVQYADLVDALQRQARRWFGTTIADAGQPSVTIHAEGTAVDEDTDVLDFGQSALLTEVVAHPTRPAAPQVAFERFGPDGPLALLPVHPTGHRYSVVWCDAPPASEARAALPAHALSAALQRAFGDRLGPLQIAAPVEVVALRRVRRRTTSRDDQVWIGNTAQALHPVAGQGLNLGIRDAFELARHLAAAEDAGRDEPIAQRLRAYAESRRADRVTLTTLTDTLARGFRWPVAHRLQASLLTALDLLPALQRPLTATLLYGRRRAA